MGTSSIAHTSARWLALGGLMLTLLLPAALLLSAGADAQTAAGPDAPAAGWELAHSAPAGVSWYGITFVDAAVGYAIGGPDWNVNNGVGPAYFAKTTNGGKTWTSQAIPGTDGWMRGITCSDVNNCWIAGRNRFGTILRTTDGGAHWSTISNFSGYDKWLWSAGRTGVGTTVLAGTTC
jgi:photosystem II stability/assembly factor-like uncharacterized protein